MRVDRRGFLRLLGVAALLPAPARARAAAGAPAIHTRTRNTALGALGERRAALDESGPFKPYPGAERLALPETGRPAGQAFAELLQAYAPTPGFAREPLSLADLARLLHLTNGVTGRRWGARLRAAPSAGALYAGEVYVVVQRVPELAPGIYYYDVAEHALCRLRSGENLDVVADALEAPGAVRDAAVVVILTNLFRRYSVRYRNRGYRYALIDSGHIGENLRLSARSLGLGETAPLRFHDDALNALLEIDGRDEAVCAVHALGAVGKPAARSPGRLLAEKQQLDPEVLQGPGPLTLRYHEATKLVPAPGASPPARPGPTPSPRGEPGLELSRGPLPDLAIEQAIRRRRSADAFASAPVTIADLAFVLDAAAGTPVLERAPGVDLYVIPHRVIDAARGLYRLERDPVRLLRLQSRDLRVALQRACGGQTMAGSAAVAVAMAARFEASDPALGTRRYRDQLLECGAIGQRIYLAAEALGLAARNLAAFLDDDLNALLGLDPRREGVVHLTVFGREKG